MMIPLLAERALSIWSFTAIDSSADSNQAESQQGNSPVSIARHLQQEENEADLKEGTLHLLGKLFH